MAEAKLSTMMQQYIAIKDEYKDTILMYRLGDFYEMFFDDALLASRELELTLTGRNCGLEERAPMCGVPHHSVDQYIVRLVNNGHKVATRDSRYQRCRQERRKRLYRFGIFFG